jgi:Xaa-Pro aminopeptidase
MLIKIQEVLEKYNKKVWVMYNKSNSDKYFCKYISSKLSTNTICIISQNDIYLLVNILDKENTEELIYNSSKVHILVYSNEKELNSFIEEIIAKLKFPNEISFSYSTMNDISTDILTHGDYISLSKLFKKPYLKYSKKIRITSAEKIIYEIASKKTDKQIKRLKLLACITDRILEETFNTLSVKMSEKEIVELTISNMKSIMKMYIGSNDIVDFDLAWDNCPIVLVGANLAKGGHSVPSDTKLKKGDTIYFDFGIKVIFKDKEELYTDMQRMGYALKENEAYVPKSVEKVFNTLVNAIEDGIDELKPGVKAYKIDELVRNKIIKAGYPDYIHATGHPVGNEVHDIGAVISLKQSKRANLDLIEGGVYTLEPRVNIANGGSIEEMILVTKFGGVTLCSPQKKIYLVK